MKRRSKKNYTVAVCLAGVFGPIGVEYFYVGRWLEGLFDVLLTIGAIYFFFSGKLPMALLFLAIDLTHSFVTTIMLMTGNLKDGEGAYICYPGQQLK